MNGKKKVCEICGDVVESTYKCKICGRTVCSKEYFLSEDLCEICVMTRCEICQEELSVGVCELCGKLVCEDCSVEKGAARVCLRCLNEALHGVC